MIIAVIPALLNATGAIILVALFFYTVRMAWLHRNEKVVSAVLTVDFERQSLRWHVNEPILEQYAGEQAILFNWMCIPLWLTIVIVQIIPLYSQGAFSGLHIEYLFREIVDEVVATPPAGLNLLVAWASSCGFLYIILKRAKLKERVKRIMSNRIRNLIDRTNSRVEEIGELFALEESINALASKMKIPKLSHYETEIRDFVNTHKKELISGDLADLTSLIAKNIELGRKDEMHLGKADAPMTAVMKYYTHTAREVNKTASIPLIKELEYDYEGLASDNLKLLLSQKKWDDYMDVVNAIMEELQRLNDLSIKYQKEADRMHEEERSDEMKDEDKACHILGVPTAATNDQIKKAYKVLASMWHPDARVVQDDTRMREINLAYDCLRQVRNIN